MAMDFGGPRCAKYTLYTMNVLIIILACVTLGIGIKLSTNISSFTTAINPELDPTGNGVASVQDLVSKGSSQIKSVSNILITSGVIALLIGFLGCYAAYKESKTLLITYGVIMILVVLLELGAGIAYAVDRPQIRAAVDSEFWSAIANYDYVKTRGDLDNHIVVVQDKSFSNKTATDTMLINILQVWIGCCGGENGYRDFEQSPYWMKSHATVPVFCCKMNNTKTLQVTDPACLDSARRNEENSWMNTGCYTKGAALVKKNFKNVVGVAIGIGLIDILGIIFAFYFYYCLTHGYHEF